MQSILVYDPSAEEIEDLASKKDMSVAEVIEELLDFYKENS